MKTKEQTITLDNIRSMVDFFYAKVLKDEKLAPFFVEKLGSDLKSQEWQTHLQTLTNFWASLTLGDTSYRGQPVKPHMHMEGLQTSTFEAWLVLFFEAVDALYSQKVADIFKTRSEMIATNFMRMLGLNNSI